MDATEVVNVLVKQGVPCYPDRQNPTYTVHGDKGEVAFLVDSCTGAAPWEIVLIGSSAHIGLASTPDELANIIRSL